MEEQMAFSGDWSDGIRTGNYHNQGTKKRKKTGKRPPHPRGLKKGIRKIRIKKR
jgi:hypothetical protein